ncbi:ABC transporter permease [Nocardioides sp. SOB77]|uniref:ABC transporter permease n=1 Tax=Nocardioides oceani TaxID=3058369 RepID=A0ABT8FJ15_9ACTN|nr:ABC transporter permease [Nocardioides oceani]MDN4174663.1 ABC transporter permease [Nocardioides oceani]
MAEPVPARALEPVRLYGRIARMWIRASLAYPVSFWTMTIGAFFTTALDFVGVWILFGTIDGLGGFGLQEVALLYGASGIGIGVADLLIGSVEQVGQHVRTGSLDVMLVRPVPLLVQVCADRFQLRRLGRIAQASAVLAYGFGAVDWSPARLLVAIGMVLTASVVFFCLFVTFASVQFWTADSSEFANAFTYGGNVLTQYPLTVFPGELVKMLTFVLPVAFVNWYPCLYLLGRDDPFGLPAWLQVAGPLPALLLCGVAALVWRAGVRHYESTGS